MPAVSMVMKVLVSFTSFLPRVGLLNCFDQMHRQRRNWRVSSHGDVIWLVLLKCASLARWRETADFLTAAFII
jgi:hypothetical protein